MIDRPERERYARLWLLPFLASGVLGIGPATGCAERTVVPTVSAEQLAEKTTVDTPSEPIESDTGDSAVAATAAVSESEPAQETTDGRAEQPVAIAVDADAQASSPPEATEEPAPESSDDANSTAGEEVAAGGDKRPARVFSSSRAPARPGEAEKISFDDLIIGLQADVVYRPWMMKDRPKELDGKRVQIMGYMHGGIENPEKVPEFVLLRNLECKFGPGGQADHLAMVYMKPGNTTTYVGKDSIKVEGVLKIEPFVGVDGNTWSLYRIEEAMVVR